MSQSVMYDIHINFVKHIVIMMTSILLKVTTVVLQTHRDQTQSFSAGTIWESIWYYFYK